MTQASTAVTAGAASTVNDAIAKIIAQATAQLGASKAAILAPILAQYAPIFAGMAEAEVWAWINLALSGSPYDAYQAILAKMSPADVAGQWAVLGGKWQAANQANADAMAARNKAAGAILEALVSLALAAVGL